MNDLRGSYKVADNALRLSFLDQIENKTKHKQQTILSSQKWCAVGQLIIGIVSTVSGIITMICSRGPIDGPYSKNCREIDNSSFGMWSGVIYIATGVLGAYGSNKMKELQIPLYIGFSIFSCVVSASGIIIMFYYFALCSSDSVEENKGDLTAKTFFRFTGYVVLIFAHGNGMTFSIIGASFSCCRMKCCNQSSTMEELMSHLQDDTGPATISTCPKPPSNVKPPSGCRVEDTNEVEQIYFEADVTTKDPPISYISVQEHNSEEEETEQKSPIKKPEKPNRRYCGVKSTKETKR